MLSKPLHCSSCPLYGNGIGFSVSEGSGKNGILILGEALGRNEALEARPFRPHAESGSVLEAALSRLGLNRQDFLLYNIVNCQPPFNKLEGTGYEYDAIETCSKYVKDLIKKYRPKIILALGNVALKHSWRDYNLLTEKIYNAGFDKSQIRSYLKKLSVTSLRGYVLPSIHGIPLIASLHPSFIRRTGMVYLGVLMRDIRLALLHLEGKTPKFSTENYKVNPSEGELQIFLDFLHKNPNIPLAYDIETPFTTLETDEKDVDYRHIPVRDIDSIQFSAKAGEAIFLTLGKDKDLNRNWCWAKEILNTKNPKVGFNCLPTNTNIWTKHNIVQLSNLTDSDELFNSSLIQKFPQRLSSTYELRLLLGQRIIATPEHKFPVLVKPKYKYTRLNNKDWLRFKYAFSDKSLAEIEELSNQNDIYFKILLRENINLDVDDISNEDAYNLGLLYADGTYKRKIKDSTIASIWFSNTNKVLMQSIKDFLITHSNNWTTESTRRAPIKSTHKQQYNVGTSLCNNSKLLSILRFITVDDCKSLNITELSKLSTTQFWSFVSGLIDGDGCISDRIAIANKTEDIHKLQELFAWNGVLAFIDRNKDCISIVNINENLNRCVSKLSLKVTYKRANLNNIYWTNQKWSYAKNIKFRLFRNFALVKLDTIDLNLQSVEVMDIETDTHYFVSHAGIKTHNCWEFDDLNIKYHFGQDYPIGGSLDEMWMSKWWNQDYGSSKLNSHGLSLQWTTSLLQEGIPAWKHTSFDDPFIYGNVDADVTLRNFQVLKTELEKRKLEYDCFVSKEHPNGKPVTNVKTLYQGFVDDVVKLNPILKAAARRGFPISVVELEKYKKKIKAEIARVYDELQSKYPKKLLRRSPLKGYKNEPKEVTTIKNAIKNVGRFNVTEPLYIVCNVDDNGEASNYDSICTPDSKSDLALKLIEKVTKTENGESGLVQRSFLLDSGVTQKRWCRLEDFKVNSKQQVIAYLEYKGYKLKKKKNKTTHKMETTTSKDIITQLYEETHDEFLGNIVYLRELQKLLSTYLGEGRKKSEWQIQNIDLDGIGTVHTTFGYWPVSGQLSSKNPNIQNQPKYGSQWSSEGYAELAKEFRKIIKARRNKCLIEFDYKSYHALTTAFEAEDSEYMRLVRLDIHSYFAAHIIRSGFPIQKQKLIGKLLFAKSEEKKKVLAKIAEMDATLEYISDLDEWLKYDDEKLKEKLRWVKDNYEFIRNRMAKPTILGIPYGMGAKRLYEENIRSFENVEQARMLLALIHRLFPKINIWQSKIRQLADRKGYLISRYGYLQRFYNVYDYRPLKEKRSEHFDETIFLSKRDNRWWSKRNGTDSEKVVSYYPQNNAFAKIKEAIRECDEVGYLEKYGFCNTIHDSLLFECDLELKDECIRNVKEVMERPAKFLVNKTAENGLVCSVDISIGNSWGSLQEIKL